MAEFTLTAQAPLQGADLAFPGVSIQEVTDYSLLSLACPTGGKNDLQAFAQKKWQLDLPEVGQSDVNTAGDVRLLGMQRDQWFVWSAQYQADAEVALRKQLQGAGYVTDQSDSWAILRVAGPDSRTLLERICPLDLHPAVFGIGSVSRTVMEHLGVVILCEAEDQYLLFSARSSAESFLHAVVVSAENIV